MTDEAFHLLGVAPGASPKEIKRAFRRIARQMHPDVSANPEHVELFKRVILAYEALMQDAGLWVEDQEEEESQDHDRWPPDKTEATATDTADLRWDVLQDECLRVVADLRHQAEDEERGGDHWVASSYRLAAEILEKTVKEFAHARVERTRLGNASSQPERPFLLDSATKFVQGTQELWERPDERLQANLAKGALGAVGLTRVSSIVGRGADAVDKEVFARAVMSSLAAGLLRGGVIAPHQLASPTPELPRAAALMEATNALSTAELSGRRPNP